MHRRENTSALNASVCCEQKRLQRLSETVPANNRIPQAVRQGIPDRRTSHTESPSAIELSWWCGVPHHQLSSMAHDDALYK